ncbi:glutathione S-transferase [Novosphingobium sp. ZN18A2]|uniref:glutathione S-transferase n=1 Tax=Novosphingobium sp. ZN18A2 TaxID=3079861 RepID=UPI0030D53EDA
MHNQAQDLILHHYDASPFSNKVRMQMGLKRLTWQSVITPNMMPKPDLVPLTGGYRRAPVMQIGADVYCDSQVIMAEIERRNPGPATSNGMDWPINLWADRLFFQLTVAIIFGQLGDRVEPAFIADREKLSGKPFDVKAMAAAAEPAKGQWRAQAGWIEQALSCGGTAFLDGSEPGIGDLAAHMNIWFLASVFPDQADNLMEGYPALARWRAALEAIGQGNREEMTAAKALEIARKSDPAPCVISHDEVDPSGLAPGDRVTVMADDYGRDPISGELVALASQRIAIHREDADLGHLHLHFPRAGFVVVRSQ